VGSSAPADLPQDGQRATFEKSRRLVVDRDLLAELERASGNSAERDRPEQADADYDTVFQKAGLAIDATDPIHAGKLPRSIDRPLGEGSLFDYRR
jgi:hypothetical protein